MAWISACALGSQAAIGLFQPSPKVFPSKTTTAPTGTSPSAWARCASSSARRMKASSVIPTQLSTPGRKALWERDFVAVAYVGYRRNYRQLRRRGDFDG